MRSEKYRSKGQIEKEKIVKIVMVLYPCLAEEGAREETSAESLGCADKALGLREWIEGEGHELVTSTTGSIASCQRLCPVRGSSASGLNGSTLTTCSFGTASLPAAPSHVSTTWLRSINSNQWCYCRAKPSRRP